MTGDDSTDRETVTAADVYAARDRFDDDSIVQRTPVDYSRSISRRADAEVHLKMEHLQRTGSFKTRGAYNKLRTVADDGDCDRVVAASAGNHAQGVALAAAKTGVPATIVMPRDAPQAKVEATRGYGAEVILEGGDFQEAMDRARELTAREGTVFVHAFDDPLIVAGQGTIGIEVVEDVPEVETVVVPIGGGGLIGGIGAVLADLAPDARVVGVQAAEAATVPNSLDKGEPVDCDEVDTLADGIATGGISELTLSLLREHVDEVVTVTDEEIARAVLLLLERAKQLVEGAGAASVAALLSDDLELGSGPVVPIVSGGNLDMSLLGTILTHELTARKQLIRLQVRIDDEPGQMANLSRLVSDAGANIRAIDHVRSDADLSVGEAFLVFVVETSGESHARQIRDAMEADGYGVERVN